MALAPPAGSRQVLGETSRPAEALGVEAGMPIGEALARCPSLLLITPDPARAAEIWERILCRLEGIGAAVESARPGEAFFGVDGLLGLYGGGVDGVLAAARDAIGTPALFAAAPTRFASALAAARGRRLPRSADSAEAVIGRRTLGAFLAPHPVTTLRGRLEPGGAEDELIGALGQLGIKTLGRLAELTDDQMADRFGRIGLRALRLARGEDTPLRPRAPQEELAHRLELPDGTAGEQLERALGLLVDGLLAMPARRGRTLLTVRLDAPLCAGGSWSAEQGLGRPTAVPATIRALLMRRLEELPGPASALRLRALALGPPAADQLELTLGGKDDRRRRLAAAVGQVRAAQGPEALWRVLDADPDSPLPERRFLLTPFR